MSAGTVERSESNTCDAGWSAIEFQSAPFQTEMKPELGYFYDIAAK